MASTSWGSEPPLVSHSTRVSAPCSAAASSTRRLNSGLCFQPSKKCSASNSTRTPASAEELDRVGHHGLALVERGPQRLGDVVVPALADDAHRGGAGVEQVAQGGVVVDLARGATGGAEGHQQRPLEAQLARRPVEELDVLGVGAGPAALDEVHAELVELVGDAQLVVDGERDALELGAVAQGGVVDLDGLGQPGVAGGEARASPARSPGLVGSGDMFDPVLVAVGLRRGSPCGTPRRWRWSSGRGTGSGGRRPS